MKNSNNDKIKEAKVLVLVALFTIILASSKPILTIVAGLGIVAEMYPMLKDLFSKRKLDC